MRLTLDRLDPQQRNTIATAQGLIRDTGARGALVGGCVRDLLLGLPAGDLDFVVEEPGPADHFATQMARLLGATIHRHPAFLTCRLENIDGLDPIDVVTARSETYAEPGALPSVIPAAIESDLHRRDFTVNCIALDLASGELIDPTGGLADLEERKLRALHERSFVDDPTRIYRLLRLAARLSLSIEPRTAGWCIDAIRDGALHTISSARVRRELDLALEEDPASMILDRFAASGALDGILGCENARDAVLSVAVDASIRLRGDRQQALVAALDPSPAAQDIARLWGSGRAERIRRIRQGALRIAEVAARVRNPARFASAVLGAPLESTAILRDRDVRERAIECRVVASGSEISASTLLDAGARGALIGRILQRTRVAVAAGMVTPDRAEEFARDRAVAYLEGKRTSQK